MNIQPVEKQQHRIDGALDVHSVFYTIQGEGPFVGRPAVFVRLAGCNLQCPKCDTDYTSKRHFIAPEVLVDQVHQHNNIAASLVVITGGEPFRQRLQPFVAALLGMDYFVQIETNGTLYQDDLPYDDITIVCSPKAGKVNAQLAPHIDAYKYVLCAGNIASDGLPMLALDHPASPQVARPHAGYGGPIYVQPEDCGVSLIANNINLEATVASALKHGYTLGIQLHKYIGKE